MSASSPSATLESPAFSPAGTSRRPSSASDVSSVASSIAAIDERLRKIPTTIADFADAMAEFETAFMDGLNGLSALRQRVIEEHKGEEKKQEGITEERQDEMAVDALQAQGLAIQLLHRLQKVQKFAKKQIEKLSCLKAPAPSVQAKGAPAPAPAQGASASSGARLSYLPTKDEVANRIDTYDKPADPEWRSNKEVQIFLQSFDSRTTKDKSEIKEKAKACGLNPYQAARLIKNRPQILLYLPEDLRSNIDLILLAMYCQQEAHEMRLKQAEWSSSKQNDIGTLLDCAKAELKRSTHFLRDVAETFGWGAVSTAVSKEKAIEVASGLDLAKMTNSMIARLAARIKARGMSGRQGALKA